MNLRRRFPTVWFAAIAAGLAACITSNLWLAQRVTAQRLTQPRIAPVAKDAWTGAQREILGPLEAQGRAWNVFTTMANHPALAKDWLQFGGHILSRSTLPARDREILILRIGWLCRSEYEWAQHTRIGDRKSVV